MAEILITRDDCGKLVGLDEADQRAYGKFIALIKALVPGECVRLAFWIPRSPKFHKRHFAILSAFFKSQEQFDDREQFRMWVQVGSGHCDFVPGPKGRMVALPRSIAWHKLDDAGFTQHHDDMIRFFRSGHFAQFLWPHLPEHEQGEMVEVILQEFQT